MWDGTKAGAFAEIEGAEFISGSVVPDNTIQQIANVRFALTSFRPYSEMAIPYAQSMEVMPHVGDIDGARCRILSFGVEPSGRFRVWVDPGRHYLPLRVEQVKGNATLAQYDIEYRERSAGEWLPSGASTVLPREDGFVLLRSRAVVTSCEKLASVNESAFVIDFPVGARVHDQVDDTCYILRPDGERRVILPSELGASYESLVNTDTGHARSYRTGTWWKSVLWGLALLACVAVTMGFVWRWRARAAARKS
jgi:hypothetical protein